MPYIDPEQQRAYQRQWMKRKKLERKRILVASKGGACERCGYDRCLKALEFHHSDPAGKEFTITDGNRSLSSLLEEAMKCELLCANCHREEHSDEE